MVIDMVFLVFVVMDCMLESLFVLDSVLDLDLMLIELRLPINLLFLVLREGDRVPAECCCIGDPPGTGEPWIGLRDGERGDRRMLLLRADAGESVAFSMLR